MLFFFLRHKQASLGEHEYLDGCVYVCYLKNMSLEKGVHVEIWLKPEMHSVKMFERLLPSSGFSIVSSYGVVHMACANILFTVHAIFLDKKILLSHPILHWSLDKIETIKFFEFVFACMLAEDFFTVLK